MDNNNHTLKFLVELDDIIIEQLLTIEKPQRIVDLIQNASTNDQSYILGSLENNQAQSIIELLKKEEKEDIDPAVATGAFVTTNIDIFGILIYFVISGYFFKI